MVMTRQMRVLSLLIGLLVLGGPGIRAQSPPSQPYAALLAATRPVQFKVTNASRVLVTMNRCTAFYINRERHLWLTVAHCLVSLDDVARGAVVPQFFVDGHEADLFMVHPAADLAIIRTADWEGPEGVLPLALQGVPAGGMLYTAGFPLGTTVPFVFAGTMSRPQYAVPGGTTVSIMQLTSAPGQSGSPVVDSTGHVVSVAQSSWGQEGNFAHILGGVTWEALKSFAGESFE